MSVTAIFQFDRLSHNHDLFIFPHVILSQKGKLSKRANDKHAMKTSLTVRSFFTSQIYCMSIIKIEI